MSIKSLGVASLGLLKRGLKKTLHIASLGLLRIDGVQPEEIFIQPGGAPFGGRQIVLPDPMEGNNLAVLLTSHSLI